MSLIDLGKRLLEAAKLGQTEVVRALMASGAPFTTDWLGASPLHFAAQYGHPTTCEVLLRAGISRDARTKVDRTPLHLASQEGHQEIVELLLENDADIDAKDMLRMTPLHWAVENGHFQVIQSLLKTAADIHAESKFDQSPYDIAIYNGRHDIAELLQMTPDEVATAQASYVEVPATEPEIVEVTTSCTDETGGKPHKRKRLDSNASNQSSTSVLATLAALAEASGPISSENGHAETLNWLESHGITMIEGENLISPQLERGQLTLTEAGKLALNLVKQDTTNGDELGEEKVITIVSQHHEDDDSDAEDTKPCKDDLEKMIVPEINSANMIDQLELRRQLEEVQKQAEIYKEQLRKKEKEAECYKRKLGQMGNTTKL